MGLAVVRPDVGASSDFGRHPQCEWFHADTSFRSLWWSVVLLGDRWMLAVTPQVSGRVSTDLLIADSPSPGVLNKTIARGVGLSVVEAAAQDVRLITKAATTAWSCGLLPGLSSEPESLRCTTRRDMEAGSSKKQTCGRPGIPQRRSSPAGQVSFMLRKLCFAFHLHHTFSQALFDGPQGFPGVCGR